MYLPPYTHTDHDAEIADRLVVRSCKSRRLAKPACPNKPHVRRKLTPDFIPHSNSEFSIANAPADAEFGYVLEREVGLDARLGNQPLGYEDVVIDLGPCSDFPFVANEGRDLDLEPLWRETLHPKYS